MAIYMTKDRAFVMVDSYGKLGRDARQVAEP